MSWTIALCSSGHPLCTYSQQSAKEADPKLARLPVAGLEISSLMPGRTLRKLRSGMHVWHASGHS